MIFAFPVGVLAAIYMNEYVRDGWPKKIIKQMTNNLAGVPSIVFGLFGMSLFVNKLEFGDSILAGGLTLGLLVLPVIIRTTEESLKAVDDTFRQASLGLGASKWETTSKIVFPIAFPNIITGLILSIGRVSGETAPILFTVAAYFLPKLPTSIFDQAMALPYHLYVIATSGTDIEKSRAMAYGTALILIIIVLISNLLANALRKYYGKKVKMN
jgi:phosphate transport system permease protein